MPSVFCTGLGASQMPGIQNEDIRNTIETIANYDAVYHLAGISGLPSCAANPASAQVICVTATKELVHALSDDQFIICASTTSFYGKSTQLCDEQTSIEQVS